MGTKLPPPPKKEYSPQFLAHVCCGQTAGWIKMPLGTEVGLGPGHIASFSEVVGSQISLDSVQPRDTVLPWWSLPVGGGAIRIILASASSSIRAMCPNMERCRNWIIAVRLGCLVILLTSSLQTDWCHLIPSSVLRHHWSRASILRASTLVIAQHSDPYLQLIHRVKWRHISVVAIRLPFCRSTLSYCA